jgi:hypothetical protein
VAASWRINQVSTLGSIGGLFPNNDVAAAMDGAGTVFTVAAVAAHVAAR